MYHHISLIQSSVEGHFDSLCVWATMNNAKMNTGVHMFVNECFQFFPVDTQKKDY